MSHDDVRRDAPSSEVIAKLDKAIKHVHDLCMDRTRWRMSVPANFEQDSDLILCVALEAARTALQSAAPQALAPSDTPMTDDRVYKGRLSQRGGWYTVETEWVLADFARRLERELATLPSAAPQAPRQDVLLAAAEAILTHCADLRDPVQMAARLREVAKQEPAPPSAAPQAPAPSKALWLWKNFVDGRPEYWAFDNPFPCRENGDPMTLGEPCGYAIFKASKQGRFDISSAEVIEAIKRTSLRSAERCDRGDAVNLAHNWSGLQSPPSSTRTYADGLKDAADYIAASTFAARDADVVDSVLALLRSFQKQGGYAKWPKQALATDPTDSGGEHE